MDLALTFFRGSLIVSSPEAVGDATGVLLLDAGNQIPLFVREIAKHLRYLVVPTTVTKPRGTRGFSFHWSNAQAAWDVVTWNDSSWHTDGAEFLVYFTKDALSPLGRPWSLKEMQYVAKMLPAHPGYSQSYESALRVASAIRVAMKYLEGRA
jgi:hypothetical protein